MKYPKRLMAIFNGMKTRCYNKKRKDYKLYVANGIRICEEWLNNPKLFCEWSLNNGYSDNLTIDRIDGLSDYHPDNCRWVNKKVQANNISTNRKIEINGEVKNLTEWADEIGVSKNVLFERLKLGIEGEELLKPKKELNKLIEINGVSKTLKEWSEISGIKISTLKSRLRYGYKNNELLKSTKQGGGDYRKRENRFKQE